MDHEAPIKPVASRLDTIRPECCTVANLGRDRVNRHNTFRLRRQHYPVLQRTHQVRHCPPDRELSPPASLPSRFPPPPLRDAAPLRRTTPRAAKLSIIATTRTGSPPTPMPSEHLLNNRGRLHLRDHDSRQNIQTRQGLPVLLPVSAVHRVDSNQEPAGINAPEKLHLFVRAASLFSSPTPSSSSKHHLIGIQIENSIQGSAADGRAQSGTDLVIDQRTTGSSLPRASIAQRHQDVPAKAQHQLIVLVVGTREDTNNPTIPSRTRDAHGFHLGLSPQRVPDVYRPLMPDLVVPKVRNGPAADVGHRQTPPPDDSTSVPTTNTFPCCASAAYARSRCTG